MIKKKTRNIILAVLGMVILMSINILYVNYNSEKIRTEYDAKMSTLNNQLLANLANVQTELASNINSLGTNLTSQLGIVRSELNNFKKQNQQEITTLSSLIDQIEQQSDIKLNELKAELKNVQIRSADFSGIVNDVLQSVVSVKTNLGQGSGVIIDAKGYVVTNVHVISGASSIRVATFSGNTYNVNELIGYDSLADIAVLKIDAPSLAALDFGDSASVKVGEKVIAAGNPAGLAFTVTEGIVSAVRKDENGINYVQTDVPINPGNSGGPLVNSRGEIIGINNFKIGGFEGLGFAISSNNVKDVVNGLIKEYEAKQRQ